MWIISFDIDGTMEFGDPGGVLTREHVLGYRAQGALVGSASDRPESTQLLLWRTYGLEPDFVVLKHRMVGLREQFPDADAFWHVGDGSLDQRMSRQAGFTFFWPDQFPPPREHMAPMAPTEQTPEEAARALAVEQMETAAPAGLPGAIQPPAALSLDGHTWAEVLAEGAPTASVEPPQVGSRSS